MFGFVPAFSLLQTEKRLDPGDKPFESGRIICLSCIQMLKGPSIELALRATQSATSSKERAVIDTVGDGAPVEVGDGESPIVDCTWGHGIVI